MNYDNINSALIYAQVEEAEAKAKAKSETLQHKRDTALQKTAESIQAQQKLLESQLEKLKQQNELLMLSYKKLEEQHEVQSQSYKQSCEELKSSKRYNRIMLWVSVASALVAVVSVVINLL